MLEKLNQMTIGGDILKKPILVKFDISIFLDDIRSYNIYRGFKTS